MLECGSLSVHRDFLQSTVTKLVWTVRFEKFIFGEGAWLIHWFISFGVQVDHEDCSSFLADRRKPSRSSMRFNRLLPQLSVRILWARFFGPAYLPGRDALGHPRHGFYYALQVLSILYWNWLFDPGRKLWWWRAQVLVSIILCWPLMGRRLF